MQPDQVFQYCNTMAMFTWILLILVPYWKWTSRIVIGGVVTLLALCYVFYLSQSFSLADFQKFGSLAGIMELFSRPEAVLAGWIHYLAFDLMVGWFICFDSRREKISHIYTVPALLLTFMAGPFGLLVYLALRLLIRRKYFISFDTES